MTATTRVSPAEVQALSQYVSQKSGEIGDALTDLDNKVSQLKQSWDGEAKEAYEQAQRQWTAQINEMNALLSRVSGKLVEIGSDYSATDRRGANRFAV